MFHVKHTRLFLSFSRLRIVKIELFMFHVKRDGEFYGKMIVSRETSGAKFRTKRRKTERNATDERQSEMPRTKDKAAKKYGIFTRKMPYHRAKRDQKRNCAM